MMKDVDKSDKCFQSWRYYRDCGALQEQTFPEVMFSFGRFLVVPVQVMQVLRG